MTDIWTNTQSKAIDDWKQRNQQQPQVQQQHQPVQQQQSQPPPQSSSSSSVIHPPISLRSAFGIQTNSNNRQQHQQLQRESWHLFVFLKIFIHLNFIYLISIIHCIRLFI